MGISTINYQNKILQIHDYNPLEGGGVQINVSEVSRALVEQGNQVTIATPELINGQQKACVNRVSYLAVIKREDLYRLIDEADIINIHFTFSCRPLSTKALEYCVKTNKKCVFSLRTNYDHVPFSALSKLSKKEKALKLEKVLKLMENPNVILSAPSLSVGKSLEVVGFFKEIKIINNGISKRALSSYSQQIPPPEQVDFTYIGTISALKGIFYLLEAVRITKRKIPAIKVRLIGAGPELDLALKITEFFELEDNMIFEGYVANSYISAYLSATKAIIHPSLTETWGNSIAEALAAGIPTIATKIYGITDLTKNGEFAELVPAGSAEKLAQALTKFLMNPSIRANLKRKAKKAAFYINSNLTIEKQAENLINLYKTIA
jgi:glycosyltransferase involved in cell wall biosynthesis